MRDITRTLKFFCGLARIKEITRLLAFSKGQVTFTKKVGKEISMSRKMFQRSLDLLLGGLLTGQRDVSEICRFFLR